MNNSLSLISPDAENCCPSDLEVEIFSSLHSDQFKFYTRWEGIFEEKRKSSIDLRKARK